MKNIMFSICIPSYHYEQYIEDLIKSIFCQNYDNFEIIICDQENTDSSFLLTKYKNIRLLHLDLASTYNARCELIKHVKGDYFLQIDADDYLVSDALKTINKIINETNFKDIYYYRKREFINDCHNSINSGFFKEKSYEDFLSDIYIRNSGDNFNEMSTKCIKRIQNFAYKPKVLINNEDGYLLLQLMKFINSYVFINRVFYIMRKHGTNISKSFSDRKIMNQLEYFNYVASLLDKKYHISILRSILYDIHNSFYYFYKQGRFDSVLWKSIFKSKIGKRFIRNIKRSFVYYFNNIDCKKYLLINVIGSYKLYRMILKRTLKHEKC